MSLSIHKILSETNGSQLKIDGWKTIVPFGDGPFSEETHSFQGMYSQKKYSSARFDSKIRLNKKNLWQTSSRCLVANFRDRVLRASALDDTQNSLHKDFSRSPHWWDSYHEPILQGILDWGPLEFPLNFLVGIYGCEGKKQKKAQVGKGKKHENTKCWVSMYIM